jgi:hypothetical protein
MRVRIDESRHHDAALGIDLDRIGNSLEIPPTLSSTGRDNDAVACGDPSTFDRTHITCCRADPGLLIFERRQSEKPSAPDHQIRFHERHHSRK